MPPEAEATAAEVTFRPATLDDAKTAADLWAEMDPDELIDPELMRHWWQETDPSLRNERWMALDGTEAVAATGLRWAVWEKDPSRNCHLQIAMAAGQLDIYGDAVYGHAEHRAAEVGGRTLWAYSREFSDVQTRFLAGRGYEEVSIQRSWELDLEANASFLRSMAETYRSRMREQGIRLLTLAEDDDPDWRTKLYALNDEAQADEPSDVPHVHLSYGSFERWLATPGVFDDRTWIARQGPELVGVSRLRFPAQRGSVWTTWTGTARSIRGRGVARALKLETLLQAIDLGVKTVRTSNDFRNAPILHLNEELGYRPIPGVVRYRKQAQTEGGSPGRIV